MGIDGWVSLKSYEFNLDNSPQTHTEAMFGYPRRLGTAPTEKAGLGDTRLRRAGVVVALEDEKLVAVQTRC